jgi:hypothetical protein
LKNTQKLKKYEASLLVSDAISGIVLKSSGHAKKELLILEIMLKITTKNLM